MAKSKYESHVLPRFDEIASWVKQGATDEDIYRRLGIGKQTFYDYKNRHADFADLLKKNYEYCTDQVENALFQKALKGNVIAQIFWLKNRRPDKWREAPTPEEKENPNEKLDELIASLDKHVKTHEGKERKDDGDKQG